MNSEEAMEYYKYISRARELLILADLTDFPLRANLPVILQHLEAECKNTRNMIIVCKKAEKKK